jgi:hypothetical protein
VIPQYCGFLGQSRALGRLAEKTYSNQGTVEEHIALRRGAGLKKYPRVWPNVGVS